MEEMHQSPQEVNAAPPPVGTMPRATGAAEEAGAGPPCAGNLGAMDVSDAAGEGPPPAGSRGPVQNLQQNVLIGVSPEQYANDMAVASAMVNAATGEVSRIKTAANEYIRWTQSEVASLVQQASQKYNLDMDAAADAVKKAQSRAENAEAEAGNAAEYAKAVAEHAYACALHDMKLTVEQARMAAQQQWEQAEAKIQANEARLGVAIRDVNEHAKRVEATNKSEVNRIVAEYERRQGKRSKQRTHKTKNMRVS